MNPERNIRLSLVLPVGSSQAIRAATQVVLYLLRYVGRTELDMLRATPNPRSRRDQAAPGSILFVTTTTGVSLGDDVARGHLERIVRGYIERRYTRHGIMPVAYVLELL